MSNPEITILDLEAKKEELHQEAKRIQQERIRAKGLFTQIFGNHLPSIQDELKALIAKGNQKLYESITLEIDQMWLHGPIDENVEDESSVDFQLDRARLDTGGYSESCEIRINGELAERFFLSVGRIRTQGPNNWYYSITYDNNIHEEKRPQKTVEFDPDQPNVQNKFPISFLPTPQR